MKTLMAIAATASLLTSLCTVADAGSQDYYVKRYSNPTYDSPGTPFAVTVAGPFSAMQDCEYERSADAREDNFHHIFVCTLGR